MVGDPTASLGNLCQRLVTSVTSAVKKVFPDVQSEPPVLQFVHIASRPVTGHHRKEPGSIFFTPSIQVFIYIDEILPELSLLEPKQSQLSQCFLIGEMLQPIHHLWTLSSSCISLL